MINNKYKQSDIDNITQCLSDACKEFSDFMYKYNNRIASLDNKSEESTEQPKSKSKGWIRKHTRWTDDVILEFLCDCEDGLLSDDEIMNKWHIPNKYGITKKLSYINSKLKRGG